MAYLHFPIPQEINPSKRDEYIFPYGRVRTDQEDLFHYNRRLSREVQILKAQYFMVEKDMLSTFDYVYPVVNHLTVYSPKYASIIKSACNLYEIVSRKLYDDLFGISDVNIYNYLSLEYLLDLRSIKIESPLLEIEFPAASTDILNPFAELQWNKASLIQNTMIPSWWNAYNDIKHGFNNYANSATLHNALRATIAVACLCYKVYGSGVTLGKILWYDTQNGKKIYYPLELKMSELLFVNDGRMGVSF